MLEETVYASNESWEKHAGPRASRDTAGNDVGTSHRGRGDNCIRRAG